MVKKLDKAKARAKRHQRVRNKINGTADCPRLNVFRSSKHICAQVIDDVNGVTLAALPQCPRTLRKRCFRHFLRPPKFTGQTRSVGAAIPRRICSQRSFGVRSC